MITENISTIKSESDGGKIYRNLRIVKQGKNSLTISNGKEELMFKKYAIQDHRISKLLEKRFHMRHQSLLQIKSIEYAKEQNQFRSDSEDLTCGIIFQKYAKTMEQSIKENVRFTHEEVVETLTPIKDVIDYMVHQNYDPGELTYSSIVCTDNYEIKLIDSILHQPSLISTNREAFSTKLYSQLAELMFLLLFPNQSELKSWTKRYELAREHLTQSNFHFFQEVFKKFHTNVPKSSKSKKIKKQQHSKIIHKKIGQKSDIDSPKKGEALSSCQSGKQNLIIQ